MQKILTLFTVILFTAANTYANGIDRAISSSAINKSAISICVKEVPTGKIVYEHNKKKPMNPASTLKAVTYPAALNTLGHDYEFTTTLYKTTNNELYLKLGADPFFTRRDLKTLISTATDKNIYEPKSFVIDDSVIDQTEWGEGWQWDDDLNILMPKFSSYNIDQNLLTAIVEPTTLNKPATVRLSTFYPVTFINLVTTGQNNKIELSRNNSISPDILNIKGEVNEQTEISFPVNYPKRYFMIKLEETIRAQKMLFYDKFKYDKLPLKNIYVVEQITNPISLAEEEILKNSNNMVAETVFKLAGGTFAKSTGSAENAIEMLNSYMDFLGINHEDIKVVDGSGVSKNNLVTADFMTDFLVAQYQKDENYMSMLATAGEGTLKDRMLYFRNKFWAKTGTLSDVSAIAGYIKTSKGKLYAFDIMINEAKSKPSDKKMLEEYILRAIDTSY